MLTQDIASCRQQGENPQDQATARIPGELGQVSPKR